MEYPQSKIVNISSGTIEYSFTGTGPTVLISHGTLGGYDQGLAIAQLFNPDGFRFLAVSRAGYLRSDTGTGHNPQNQARSYVELLDYEGISSVFVLGLSGGAPSAISFAQDYPDRCSALVLISSITAAPPPLPPFFQLAVRMQDITMRIEPLWSLMHSYGLSLLLRSNGLTSDQVKKVLQDPHQRNVSEGIFRPIKTSNSRREGLRLDDIMINALPSEPDFEINVPILISHSANDPLASPSTAERLAHSIPTAEYLPFPDGGHVFFVIHNQQLVPQIERFISANSPD